MPCHDNTDMPHNVVCYSISSLPPHNVTNSNVWSLEVGGGEGVSENEEYEGWAYWWHLPQITLKARVSAPPPLHITQFLPEVPGRLQHKTRFLLLQWTWLLCVLEKPCPLKWQESSLCFCSCVWFHVLVYFLVVLLWQNGMWTASHSAGQPRLKTCSMQEAPSLHRDIRPW